MASWTDNSNYRTLGQYLLNTLTVVIFVFLFVIAGAAVFWGFVGYYSRVNLSTELQRGGINIDLMFMSVDQMRVDEEELPRLRSSKVRIDTAAAKESEDKRLAAYRSDEYKNFIAFKADIVQLFFENKNKLDDAYWKRLLDEVLFSDSPDAFKAEIRFMVEPKFLTNNPNGDSDIAAFNDKLIPLVQKAFRELQSYDISYTQPLYASDATKLGELEPVRRRLGEIFRRNPHLATSAELIDFRIDPTQDASSHSPIEPRHRAIVRSFDNLFVGPTRKILEWPTIASTLLVTLAMGWLGGLINFVSAAIHARSTTAPPFQEPELLSLFRRSFLGVTAALGIFLFAGSGLLVLTAQSANLATGSSIELSPYFVAFLAFISGFLADDAFARLTFAGRSLFSSKTKKRKTSGSEKSGAGSGSKKDDRQASAEKHDQQPDVIS